MHDYTNYLIFVLYKKDTKKIIPNHTHTHTRHTTLQSMLCVVIQQIYSVFQLIHNTRSHSTLTTMFWLYKIYPQNPPIPLSRAGDLAIRGTWPSCQTYSSPCSQLWLTKPHTADYSSAG